MTFNWDELTKDVYDKTNNKLSELIDNYIGFIRIGEICINIIIRDYGDKKPKLAYSYDFYVANENTGYGYKETSNIPYDYADGTDLYDLSLSYDEFVKESEKLIQDFIQTNDRKNHNYSLVEKANKPLLIW